MPVLWSVPLDLRSREVHPLYRAAAVPEGSVRASGQVVWLAAVRDHPDFAGLRADALQGVVAVAEVLARCADWSMMLSRPTHDVVAERAGVSRRTVARVRARLEAAGLVGIVTPGRTSDPVAPESGPLAQAYILTLPRALYEQLAPEIAAPVLADVPVAGGRQDDEHGQGQADPAGPVQRPPEPAPTRDDAPAEVPVDETVTPSPVTEGDSGEEPPHTREAPVWARYARGTTTSRSALDEVGFGLGREIIWPTTLRPTTRGERHLAAAEAHRIDPILRRVSVAHIAALAREWHLAGWTLADIRYALDHRPDSTPWPHCLVTADVRHVPGWVRHRLAAWRTDPVDPTSPPAKSRSQRVAAAAARAAEQHAVEVATDLATRTAAVPAGQVDGWTTHRADLAARTAAAAATRRQQAAQADADPARTADRPAEPAPTAREISNGYARRQAPAPRAPGSLRPADQTADPRIGALRAAARAARHR